MAEYRTLTLNESSAFKVRGLSRSLFFRYDAKYFDVLCAVKAITPQGWDFEVIHMGRNGWQVLGHPVWKYIIMSLLGGKIKINGQSVDVVEMMDGLDEAARLDGEFWVRVLNVPYPWRTRAGAHEIFEGIGTILEFDESFGNENSYLRVKVHADSRSKIPDRADYQVEPCTIGAPQRCTIRFVVEEPTDEDIMSMPLLRLDDVEKAAYAEAPWLDLN